jgi:hypothetical protein
MKEENIFYKRSENLTNVTFTKAEMRLLNQGLKYKLHYKHKDWLKTRSIETQWAAP